MNVPNIENVIVRFSEEEIATKVSFLADQINKYYQDSGVLDVISLANGALIFTADLLRQINVPLRLHTIKASSYFNEMKSSGKVTVTSLNLEAFDEASNLLIIDDILDTGNTMQKLKDIFSEAGLENFKICTLLNKREARQQNIDADFSGFDVQNEFLIGYGLDFQGFFRNLKYIGVLEN
ncbi:hypoxanthine phosphoribosyltransferase [Lentisphaerota bacterium WC36G]|nr:hypoxanthine phosphoribosyltransferase [Lentisphaerae bacterium WC36]